MKRITKDRLITINERLKEISIAIKEILSNTIIKKENRKKRLERRILLNIHSIEKGFAMRNFEPGHSKKKIYDLIDRLNYYKKKKGELNSFPFLLGICAIDNYIKIQESYGVKALEELKSNFNNLISDVPKSIINQALDYSFGSFSYDHTGENKSYESLVTNRHSIRMFRDDKISDEVFQEVAKLSLITPSACNRQPCYFYYANSDRAVSSIDKIITGNDGFKGEVPNYIIITCDRALFAGEEQNQWYINGGMSLYGVVVACENFGIQTCIMQWKSFYKTEKEIKQICSIDSSESIIAIIAAGYADAESKIIFAQRKKLDDYMKKVD